jgi:hypothetical protein
MKSSLVLSSEQRQKSTEHLNWYNFHQEIVKARDCTKFHLFFESKDCNLTVQFWKIRGYYHQKAIHILWFTMFIVENNESQI